mmetsp:Transcript_124662/g.248835  ORF Transcript_124662/g.248835 Transcript_124662/m.248835 type:complete len:408 (+) Transcript_124662:90-1313(+)
MVRECALTQQSASRSRLHSHIRSKYGAMLVLACTVAVSENSMAHWRASAFTSLPQRTWQQREPCRKVPSSRVTLHGQRTIATQSGRRSVPLFTNEDSWRVHAILGFFCVAHYLARFCLYAVGDVDMGFAADIPTLGFLAPHLALQFSGFHFRMPRRRTQEGSRQWPEYRWQAFVYVVCCLALLLVVWAQRAVGYPLCGAVEAIVFIRLFFSQAVIKHFSALGEYTPTFRAIRVPPFMTYFLCASQFPVTAGILAGGAQRFAGIFANLFVLQFTAFAMTLHRKRRVPHWVVAVIYPTILTMAAAVNMREAIEFGYLWPMLAVANVAALLRMELRWSKYAVWIVGAILLQCRQRLTQASWMTLATVTLVVIGVRAFQASSQDRFRKEVTERPLDTTRYSKDLEEEGVNA